MTEDATDSNATIEALTRLFMRALLLAGETSEAAEPACRLAASGWSLLRHDYPREAERLNGAMHALARNLPATDINTTNTANNTITSPTTSTTGVDDHGRTPDS